MDFYSIPKLECSSTSYTFFWTQSLLLSLHFLSTARGLCQWRPSGARAQTSCPVPNSNPYHPATILLPQCLRLSSCLSPNLSTATLVLARTPIHPLCPTLPPTTEVTLPSAILAMLQTQWSQQLHPIHNQPLMNISLDHGLGLLASNSKPLCQQQQQQQHPLLHLLNASPPRRQTKNRIMQSEI